MVPVASPSCSRTRAASVEDVDYFDVLTFDDVLEDPHGYRRAALGLPFGTVTAGDDVFHGIALCHDLAVPAFIGRVLPAAVPGLSFFRQSPAGQVEPNYIHSDAGMGDWTAVLYLNLHPPATDGTTFWRRRDTGATSGPVTSSEGKDLARWDRWQHVRAQFNRLLIFRAALFHSRAIADNYGADESARLIQVVFGRRA